MAPAGHTLSDAQMLEIKNMIVDVKAQKEANASKEAELKEKEEALRRGTQMLMDQRGSLQKKEEGLKARETELRNIANQLEGKAKRLAEREGQVAQEESHRRQLAGSLETKERELAGREQLLTTSEEELKLREQHLLGMEMDIRECPYCNVRYDMQGIRELMDEVRGYGLDLSALDKKYNEALDHMSSDAYDMALESARGILRELKTIRQDVLAKGIQYLVGSAGRTVASARQRGMEVSEAEKMLAQARKAMADRNYPAAERLAKEADYLARDTLRQDSREVRPEAALGPAAASEPSTEPAPEPQPPAEEQPPAEPSPQPKYMSYPPPQEQPEEPAPPPPAPATDKVYNCSSCFAAFKIGSSTRPVRVTCRSCGNQMIISE